MKTIGIIVFSGILAFIGASKHVQAQSALTPEQRAVLQQELAEVEAEQRKAAAELSAAQNQSASLARDINVLDAKIKSAQLKIKAKNLLIQTLGNDISQKQAHINVLEGRIDKGKETLAQILRKTNEIDSYSLPEIVLSQTSVSGFFKDVETFQSVQEGLKTTFENLRQDQANTTAEKETLDKKRNAEVDARYEIQQQEKNIKGDQATKQQLLTVSKGNEKSYTKLLAEKQARAAQIRAALFALRDAAPIPFGQALQYANLASEKTGVRPAFLLAIITQESALGSNVGKCNLSDLSSGAGVNVNSGKTYSNVMHPTRDIPKFVSILNEIGGDPLKQVVSCPLSIGWGGAMGPAQFIPSTWSLFKDRIASALGLSGTPDPWNPSHAFMASAVYLSDLGASNRTYTSERNAACRYYSGRNCGAVTGNTSYGNSVMNKADSIQRTMIDPLQGV